MGQDKPPASRWSGVASYAHAPAPAPAPDPRVAHLQSLSQQALAHLARGRADLARPLVEELAAALPGHEGVMNFVRYVAVIGFDVPAVRAPHVPAPAPPPAPESVDLVAFHMDLPHVPSGIHGAIDYGAVLVQSFESARLRAPAARRILLTDEHTRVPEALGAHEVMRFPMDPARVMYERMRVQEAFLRERPAGRATVLMDSDVVVNAEPSVVFGEDFDIGFTWRSGFPDAPFNGGMIFVAPGGGGLAFFRKAFATYEAMASDPGLARLYPRDLRAWWGDQFAHAAVVGYRAFGERTTEAVTVDGIKVRFFPCETHNFTLEAQAYAPEELRRRFFIHFKGNRKALQAQYLQAMREGRI